MGTTDQVHHAWYGIHGSPLISRNRVWRNILRSKACWNWCRVEEIWMVSHLMLLLVWGRSILFFWGDRVGNGQFEILQGFPWVNHDILTSCLSLNLFFIVGKTMMPGGFSRKQTNHINRSYQIMLITSPAYFLGQGFICCLQMCLENLRPLAKFSVKEFRGFCSGKLVVTCSRKVGGKP